MATPIRFLHRVSLPEILPIKDKQVARRHPPIGRSDTIEVIRNAEGKPIEIKSIHGTCSIFKDEEILKCHEVIRRELLKKRINDYGKKENIYIGFTQNNKAVIQQQATRGCTAAAAAMLIKDQGGQADFCKLQDCNLGDDENIKQDILSAGFKPIVTTLISNSLEVLRKQLKNYGSAIVAILDPQAGSHSIVVDEVSENMQQVRLRDPYHGWEITISAEAFLSRWTSLDCKVIQIENTVACVNLQKGHSCEKVLKI